MKLLAALIALPAFSLLGCANYSACQELRRNHARLAEIESSLAELESKPPTDERDQRKAELVMRRRMYLADNDREQAECRPIGEDRLQRLIGPDPRHR